MALVIGLHFPVLGYCAAEGEVFLGAHLVELDEHHDCDHGHAPAEIPCEEEHDFVTVDPGDFQWNPLLVTVPPMVLGPVDFTVTQEPMLLESLAFVSPISFANPPPPDIPIFRRDAALRL